MNIVKQKRIEKGISVGEMAKYLKLPVWLYWYFENNTRYIDSNLMDKILFKCMKEHKVL